MLDDLLTYWRAHPDDMKAAAALIETQANVIAEAEALLARIADLEVDDPFDATSAIARRLAGAFLAAGGDPDA